VFATKGRRNNHTKKKTEREVGNIQTEASCTTVRCGGTAKEKGRTKRKVANGRGRELENLQRV